MTEEEKRLISNTPNSYKVVKYCDFCYEKERFPQIKKENEQLKSELETYQILAHKRGECYLSSLREIKKQKEEKEQLKQQITEAKESGVVWHDLRKNPNDLPKNQNEVLCLLWEDSYYIGYYHINSKMWCFNEFSLSEDENEDEVTAWCELPRFNKELAE